MVACQAVAATRCGTRQNSISVQTICKKGLLNRISEEAVFERKRLNLRRANDLCRQIQSGFSTKRALSNLDWPHADVIQQGGRQTSMPCAFVSLPVPALWKSGRCDTQRADTPAVSRSHASTLHDLIL